MLFNSLDFAVFLPLVFILYWSIGSKRMQSQNVLLLLASYVFYAWWDWRFLGLILISTLTDFIVGAQLGKTGGRQNRKLLLGISILVNLGLLGYFKYFDFFVDAFVGSFQFMGGTLPSDTLGIILPVGISFYTFQTLSYTIDIYRNKLEPEENLISFAAFVAFFPQLVAGPIERATRLLPQFRARRNFHKDDAVVGVKQILWGLFKKLVIADGCAPFVNEIFGNHEQYSAFTLFLGAFYFAFQIYCDFSGYSDIAIGTARLFGFRLTVNFRYPYFSRNLVEFWRRWHISLYTWFRDYVYIPLGGNRVSRHLQTRNVLLVFLLSGLWHGANWTFVFWGAFHGLCILPFVLLYRTRTIRGPDSASFKFPTFRKGLQIGTTFGIILLGWVFFRAASISDARIYLEGMMQMDIALELLPMARYAIEMLPLIGILVFIEWRSRHLEFPLSAPRYSYLKISVLIAMILLFGSFSETREFIYFNF